MRLSGDSADAIHLRRAAEAVRKLGGVEQSSVATRFRLALLGLWPWNRWSVLRPEATGTEGKTGGQQLLTPEAIVASYRPVRGLPFRIDELTAMRKRARSEAPPFARLSRRAFRRRGLAAAERRIVEGQGVDGTWAGMFSPACFLTSR